MTKLFLFLLLIGSTTVAFAQIYPEDFLISFSGQKVPNSLYKTIDFIDSRPTDGMLNKRPKNVTATPISNQLTSLLGSATDSTAKNGELLLQLQLFNFTEITAAVTDRGPCYLRAILYSKKGDRYRKTNSIDTAVAIQKEANLTKATLAEGGRVLAAFITNSLLMTVVDTTSYSFDDVLDIAGIEEQKMALYHTSKYTDGLYTTYKSFMNQMPDKQITANVDDTGKISAVRIIENGEKIKVDFKDAYAIVYKGMPYIVTKYGYSPLLKMNGELFFTGDVDVKDAGDVVMGSLSEEETFEMRIDHVNGRFIRIDKIQTEMP